MEIKNEEPESKREIRDDVTGELTESVVVLWGDFSIIQPGDIHL